MNDALEDDRIRDRRHGFEEIAGDELHAITDTDLPKMLAGSFGTPRKVENSSAQFPVLLRDGAEQLARPAAHVHQMGYPAEVIGLKDIWCDKAGKLHHRRVEFVHKLRRPAHQFEAVFDALQLRTGLAGHDGFKHSAPGF